jgi:hypothetical protein
VRFSVLAMDHALEFCELDRTKSRSVIRSGSRCASTVRCRTSPKSGEIRAFITQITILLSLLRIELKQTISSSACVTISVESSKALFGSLIDLEWVSVARNSGGLGCFHEIAAPRSFKRLNGQFAIFGECCKISHGKRAKLSFKFGNPLTSNANR